MLLGLAKSGIREKRFAAGAQTKRNGGTGLAGGLLGGKHPTGRFTVLS